MSAEESAGAGHGDPDGGYGEPVPVCSAKGCRATGVWALRWNNPKLHPPQRRKTWIACAEHLQSLSRFLADRQLLREIEPVPPVTDQGGADQPGSHE